MQAHLRAIGNWQAQIEVPLRDALAASVQFLGRTGQEACKHVVIMMAQSARKNTSVAAKKRPIQRGANGRDFIEVLRQPPKPPITVWLPEDGTRGGERVTAYTDRTSVKALGKTRAELVGEFGQIKNRGLAKSSWFWGGAGRASGASEKPAPRAGMVTFGPITSPGEVGWELVNRLPFIQAPGVMKPGWEAQAHASAIARLRVAVARKIGPKWVGMVQNGRKFTAASSPAMVEGMAA
jgi:hypothetical protein